MVYAGKIVLAAYTYSLVSYGPLVPRVGHSRRNKLGGTPSLTQVAGAVLWRSFVLHLWVKIIAVVNCHLAPPTEKELVLTRRGEVGDVRHLITSNLI